MSVTVLSFTWERIAENGGPQLKPFTCFELAIPTRHIRRVLKELEASLSIRSRAGC